jgi:hypothetical protein
MVTLGQINGLVLFAELIQGSSHNKVFPDGKMGLYIQVVKAPCVPPSCEDIRSRGISQESLRAFMNSGKRNVKSHFYPDTVNVSFNEVGFHADMTDNFIMEYKVTPF